jgi:TPR repeat protein
MIKNHETEYKNACSIVYSDYPKAKEILETIGEEGYEKAYNRLGLYHLIYNIDFNKAFYYLNKGYRINPNDSYINHNLGYLYIQETFKDYNIAKGISFYIVSAKAGYAQSQTELGLIYGNIFEKFKEYTDYQKAIFWYEKAAEHGDKTALNNLGVLYGEGKGVPKDYNKATFYCQEAAKKGCE